MILYGGRSESKCQVLYGNVYSTTYVGHMQTNKQTNNSLATASAAFLCLQQQYQLLQQQLQAEKLFAEDLCWRFCAIAANRDVVPLP